GPKGDSGATGNVGPKGNRGDRGPRGLDGRAGPQLWQSVRSYNAEPPAVHLVSPPSEASQRIIELLENRASTQVMS
ncbi:hypothetical protein RRG08_060754, partial [Elysia crispata]